MHAWNHNVPGDYLRTKPEPAVLANEQQLSDAVSTRTPDQISVSATHLLVILLQKQIAQLNKHIDYFAMQLRDISTGGELRATQPRPTHRLDDTRAMQRALYRPQDGDNNSMMQRQRMQQQMNQQQMNMMPSSGGQSAYVP